MKLWFSGNTWDTSYKLTPAKAAIKASKKVETSKMINN
jgi:hypothetical protein